MRINERFWKDAKWVDEHYKELQKKYADQWIAVLDKKVVSAGRDGGKVETEAERVTKVPRNEILMEFIECGSHVYQS